MCLGELLVILKTSLRHKPVSPFPRGGDEGQGEVTPWAWLVSGPVDNDTQEPPFSIFPWSVSIPHTDEKNRILTNQPPTGEGGEGEEGMGRQLSPLSSLSFFVCLRGPTLCLPSSSPPPFLYSLPITLLSFPLAALCWSKTNPNTSILILSKLAIDPLVYFWK